MYKFATFLETFHVGKLNAVFTLTCSTLLSSELFEIRRLA